MPSCVIKWCKNNTKSNKKSGGISFHLLPTDIIIRDEWVGAIRLSRNDPQWQPSSSSVVCSDHFDKNDMYDTKRGLRRIHRTGYPKKVVPGVKIKPDPDAPEKEEYNMELEDMEKEEANSDSEDTDRNRIFEGNQDFSEITPILREMSSTLQMMANKHEDTFESFGKYVANTLRNMPERNSREMQLQIVNLLMADSNKIRSPTNTGGKS